MDQVEIFTEPSLTASLLKIKEEKVNENDFILLFNNLLNQIGDERRKIAQESGTKSSENLDHTFNPQTYGEDFLKAFETKPLDSFLNYAYREDQPLQCKHFPPL